MLKKYSDFVSESIEFIIESDVVYSDKFRLALNKIESPISKSLLDIENKDFNVQSNFFDISVDKNDTVSFTPDRKAQEIIKEKKDLVRFSGSGGWLRHKETNQDLFDKLGYTYTTGDPYRPNSSDVGEVVVRITSETSGNTYAWVKWGKNQDGSDKEGVYNVDKLSQTEDNRLKQVFTNNRQELKIGRAIRALLKVAEVDFVDKDIESFVNQYKAFIDRLNDKFSLFDVVKGDEIGHWYNHSKYYQRSGTLGQSCMSNVPTRYFDIYMSNPDVCSLIIFRSMEDNDKIIARALLWTLSDDKKFVDRIYTINDSDVQLFRDYAKEMGWYCKYHNSSSDSNQAYAPDGTTLRLNLTVNIKKGGYGSYPYLDTLKYWDRNSGTLSSEKSSGDYVLEDTGGDYLTGCDTCEGEGRVSCGNCDGDGEYECYECDGNGKEDCDECDGNGNTNCEICDGEGHTEDEEGNEIDCSDCDGTGKVDCSDCDGNGSVSCSYCDGDGTRECNECDGNGRTDCPECS